MNWDVAVEATRIALAPTLGIYESLDCYHFKSATYPADVIRVHAIARGGFGRLGPKTDIVFSALDVNANAKPEHFESLLHAKLTQARWVIEGLQEHQNYVNSMKFLRIGRDD